MRQIAGWTGQRAGRPERRKRQGALVEGEKLKHLVFPRQPKHDRICLADFYRPLNSTGKRDVVALQGVTAGPEVTELIEQLKDEDGFSTPPRGRLNHR